MANQDDDAKKPKIPILSQTNYHVWYAAVCDELYAIDAELLFEKAALDANNAEQRGNVDVAEVDLPTRKKAFIMIQRSLSQEIKAKLHDVGRGEVETLLRRVRLSFYRPSPHMVEMLHDKLSTMVVDSFPNLDAYTLEFRQTARHMVSCGGTVNDTLIRMWYLKGLPSDYARSNFLSLRTTPHSQIPTLPLQRTPLPTPSYLDQRTLLHASKEGATAPVPPASNHPRPANFANASLRLATALTGINANGSTSRSPMLRRVPTRAAKHQRQLLNVHTARRWATTTKRRTLLKSAFAKTTIVKSAR